MVKGASSRTITSAPGGFDPATLRWIATNGQPPRGLWYCLIYALGRCGDVYGPMPMEMVDADAWIGNMGGACHDLIAYAIADADWRETFAWIDPASVIETQRVATAGRGPEDESAASVAGDAQPLSPNITREKDHG